MKKMKLVMVVLVITFMTGCWNYRDLEDVVIVGAIGIDVEDDKYTVSVEIINSKMVGRASESGGSSNEASVTVFKKTAHTIKEALTKIVLESPKKIYLGHMSLLVISEEAAKKGIFRFVDHFMRDFELRKVYSTVILKEGKAEDAISILLPVESVTAANIRTNFEAIGNFYSNQTNAKFDEIMMCLYERGCQTTISTIEITGEIEKGKKNDNLTVTKPDASVKIAGSAIMKKDKLIGYLNADENRNILLIKGKVKTTYIPFVCDDKKQYGNTVLDDIQSNLIVKLVKGKPEATINIKSHASLSEYNCKVNLLDKKDIAKIEEKIEKEVKKNVSNLVKKIQKYNSDVIGVGKHLYHDNYPYWDKNEKKWDKIFPTVKFKIKVDIKIKRVGAIAKSKRGD